MNDIQLYCGPKLSNLLTECNRIKNTGLNAAVLYCFSRYEQLDNPSMCIDFDDSPKSSKCVIIAYKDNVGNLQYYWEYYSNWIKIRKLNNKQ